MDEERHHKIRTRAYELWEEAGKPDGKHAHFWKVAEKDIVAADTPQEEPAAEPGHEPPG